MFERRGTTLRTARPIADGPGSVRLPPHNLEAEESVLGACLLSRQAIANVLEIVGANDFYKPAHTEAYQAMLDLYARGEPVDAVTLAEELRRRGTLEEMGGKPFIFTLVSSVPTPGSATHYARIVGELAVLRRLIEASATIADVAYGVPDDVEQAVDLAEDLIYQVTHRRVSEDFRPIRDLLTENMELVEKLAERGSSITGLATGFHDLDELTAGLQPSNLIIVAARPSMGKSSLAVSMAQHVAVSDQVPVVIFSLEMSKMELVQRLMCAEARVDSNRLRRGALSDSDWPKLAHALGRLAEAPIFIDDTPNVTIMEMRAKCRRLASKSGLGLVIVDYLQLMQSLRQSDNRVQEVSEISRSLKILARDLEVPVIAVSQLSRNVEYRADKRPLLADLRESGCMPASTKVLRADNGEEVSLGELVLSQQQPIIWSVDHHQRLVPARLTKAFPSGIKPLFELRLASGRSVQASANHRFLTIEGWTRLDELQAGSFVAVPRRLPAPFHLGTDWSDEELGLLAHLLGDGTMGPQLKYATADDANRQYVEKAVQHLFGIETQASKVKNAWQLWFPAPYRLTHGVNHPMRNWLEPHGLWCSQAWTKFVPQTIFGLGDKQVAYFLCHLWAADGSVTVGRNGRGPVVRTYYATTSRQLALDVQRLLLRLGIRSQIGRSAKQRSGAMVDGVQNYRVGYSVRIQGAANQAAFLRQVGCYGRRGANIPEILTTLEKIKENPNVDLVPWPVAYRIREAAQQAGVTHRQLAEALGEGYCGSYLLGSANRPRRFSRDRLATIADVVGSEDLKAIATSDLYWDEVLEIVTVGSHPTFDVTIEDTHNFVADGIVAHNSIEQDADLVMFIYRDEVYNPDTAQKGIAEIHIAKHRNGPIGKLELAFLDHYTKFANLARGM